MKNSISIYMICLLCLIRLQSKAQISQEYHLSQIEKFKTTLKTDKQAAMQIADSTLSLVQHYQEDPMMIHIWQYYKARAYFDTLDYQNAKALLLPAIAFFKSQKKPEDLFYHGAALQMLGACFAATGSSGEAIQRYKEAVQVFSVLKTPEANDGLLKVYTTLTQSLAFDAERFEECERTVDEAIEAAKILKGNTWYSIGSYNQNLGVAYHIKGDISKAKEYYEKADAQYNLNEENIQKTKRERYQIVSNLGTIAYQLGDYVAAITYGERTTEMINAKGQAINHLDALQPLLNNMQCYFAMQDQETLEDHRKKVQFHLSHIKTLPENVSSSYEDVKGKVFLLQKDYINASNQFQNGVEKIRQINPDSPYLPYFLYAQASAFNSNGSTALGLEKIDATLAECKRINYQEPTFLSEFHRLKAELLLKNNDFEGGINFAELALQLLGDTISSKKETIKLEGRYRANALVTRSNGWLQGYHKSKDVTLLERAWVDYLTAQHWLDFYQSEFDAYNPELLENIRQFSHLGIAILRQKMDLTNDKQPLIDSMFRIANISKARELNERFKLNKTSNRRLIPEVNIREIKNRLDKDQMLIQYVWADTVVYVFKLNPNKDIAFSSFPIDTHIVNSIKNTLNIIENPLPDEKNLKEQAQDYGQGSYSIFQRLLKPLLSETTKRIVIVPDGILNGLPFSHLTDQKPKIGTGFIELSYLFNKYSFSTAISSVIFSKLNALESRNIELVAVAPFDNQDTICTSYPGSKKSIGNIASSCKMTPIPLFDTNATWTLFTNKCLTASHVLIYTHATVDNIYSHKSNIDFYASDTRVNNCEKIKLKQIHNLQITNNPDIIMASCSAANGKIRQGEGLQSMASEFVFAGAKSVIAPLSEVRIEAALDITQNYVIKNIKDKKKKDIALSESLKEYIENLKVDISSANLLAHPSYHSFILIGNSR